MDFSYICEACGFNSAIVIAKEWLLTLNSAAVSSNKLKANWRGRNGWMYRKIREGFHEELVRARGTLDIPPAEQQRRVWFTREYGKRKHAFDRDNLIAGFKPLRDCLTLEGLITNDTAVGLEAHYLERKSADGIDRVTLLIQELELTHE